MTSCKSRLALILGLCAMLTACGDQELLRGLDERQANEVIAALQRNDITAHKQDLGKAGYTIGVDPVDFAAAVDLLKSNHLPSKPDVEIAEMFPSDSLVSSPRAEKARLYSGIEQRLENSLRSLSQVTSARVHISYEVEDTDDSNPQPVHLSAIVVYAPSADQAVLIADVKRFLKNSVANVDYDNISVVLTPQADHLHVGPAPSHSKQAFASPALLGGLFALVLGIGAGAWQWFRRRNDSAASVTSQSATPTPSAGNAPSASKPDSTLTAPEIHDESGE
ncbi:EscJ/YscJ/HrcJ family type III secretion inner membrane ring protein [Burkholderia cepacia]|uniref:EscJ/YscJ/HrcJ family type III secretion inner membrane ring protein n=1 Tax=Burkholderia cepacia TaxID=292 RepID=UPI0009BAF6B1|nr:EscJ/YscJ/HrcJ family type III secretion inner membrane ring protein [Burkholderia cepacia]